MGQRTSVALIDDDAMLGESLGDWLERKAGMTFAGWFRDVQSYLQSGANVNLVLLDMNLRNNTTVEGNVKALLVAGASVVVISTIPDAEFVIAALEAGADAYVTKDRGAAQLAHVIEQVAKGEAELSTEMAGLLLKDRRPVRPHLSPRQREVATLYAAGLPIKAVARRLEITEATCLEHLRRLKRAYTDVGRATYTKADVIDRVREDRIELDGIA